MQAYHVLFVRYCVSTDVATIDPQHGRTNLMIKRESVDDRSIVEDVHLDW